MGGELIIRIYYMKNSFFNKIKIGGKNPKNLLGRGVEDKPL